MEDTLALDEMETTLHMYGNKRSVWEVFSSDKIMQRRIEKAGATLVKEDEYGKWYDIPSNRISFRKPREVSDEDLEKLRERGRQLAQKKNKR